MSTSDIHTVINSASRHPAVETHRPATENDIKIAMRIIRVGLPKSFLTYLRTFGWMSINGDPLFGLGPDTTRNESLVYRNADAHVEIMVRSTCVVIADDGMGNFDCLDMARVKNGECPVVFWDTGCEDPEEYRPSIVSKSFTTYLRRRLREAPRF